MTVQTIDVSYCKKDIMSVCTAVSVSQQKNCRYFSKSTYKRGCMYYRFDEFCDCIDAQINIVQENMVSTLTVPQTL